MRIRKCLQELRWEAGNYLGTAGSFIRAGVGICSDRELLDSGSLDLFQGHMTLNKGLFSFNVKHLL